MHKATIDQSILFYKKTDSAELKMSYEYYYEAIMEVARAFDLEYTAYLNAHYLEGEELRIENHLINDQSYFNKAYEIVENYLVSTQQTKTKTQTQTVKVEKPKAPYSFKGAWLNEGDEYLTWLFRDDGTCAYVDADANFYFEGKYKVPEASGNHTRVTINKTDDPIDIIMDFVLEDKNNAVIKEDSDKQYTIKRIAVDEAEGSLWQAKNGSD